MAARYVNPDNITAQGQYFYTGLPPGSYDVGRSGGSNVYGAGSGGSAGVSPDYTGADAGKSWNYPTSFEIKLPIWDKDHGMGDGGGTQGPPGTPNPTPTPTPTPGRRRRVPVSNAGPPAKPKWEDPTGGLPSAERPQLPMTIDPIPQLPSAERPQIAMNSQGENPAQGDRPMLALPQYSEPTRARMDRRNAADRARRASMIPAKDAIWGMTQVANADGTQGMWGAFPSSSASRSHSRPRTF